MLLDGHHPTRQIPQQMHVDLMCPAFLPLYLTDIKVATTEIPVMTGCFFCLPICDSRLLSRPSDIADKLRHLNSNNNRQDTASESGTTLQK